MSNEKRKPIVTVRSSGIFGVPDERAMLAPDRDPFELPGYSDKRRKMELDMRAGQDPEPLTHRFHLTRTVTMKDAADWRKVSKRRGEGYVPVMWKDAAKYGIQLQDEHGLPVAAYTEGPDGTVRNGEYMLMVCDGARAAANLARSEREGAKRVAAMTAQQTVSGQKAGMALTVEEDPKSKS